jgi:hypothetical protein
MVLVEEMDMESDETTIEKVFFKEEDHMVAREYVKRLRTEFVKEEWGEFCSAYDPVLVDVKKNTMYNGPEYLDFIKDKQARVI